MIAAISPIFRLTIGLILLTISLLLVGDLLGFIPDQKHAEFTARKAIAESLAVQVSSNIVQGQMSSVTETMHALQERNDSILSVGLRTSDNLLIANAGDHLSHWQPIDKKSSTPTHVQVPIHNQSGRWGALEISFKPLGGNTFDLFNGGSILTVILFISLSGFIAYWLFLKRALNELDPSAVVPDRVRAALDALAEGLAMLDNKGRIVFVNAAFETKLGQPAQTLVGKYLSDLEWEPSTSESVTQPIILPWQLALDGVEAPPSSLLKLKTLLNEHLSFAINIAPIKAPDGKMRGIVVTFDDVTELEHKNTDLERALDRIQQSQREITRQNRELQVLATRDPLTGALNRRSLFDGFTTLLGEAADEGSSISCIMVDIDHFKSVNDRFGHATGDKVIKLLSRVLTETARTEDLVGRYGGEEFCIVLPGLDEQQAAVIAEQMRVAVHEGKIDKFTSAIRFTASFGVSSNLGGTSTPGILVDLADKALYHSKHAGRNRVTCWSEVSDSSAITEKPIPTDNIKQTTPASSPAESNSNQQLQYRIEELEALIRSQSAHGVASTDEATGLPNRIVLIDRIKQNVERSRRLNTRLAVLFIDIDTLQVIRNTLGDPAAEKLVKLVAGRLNKTLRSTDTVAIDGTTNIGISVSRVSSGEFVVLLTDMQSEESTTWIIQRMFTSMHEPLEVESTEVLLDVRIGVSLYPNDGDDPDLLLANAGAALREAKAAVGRDVCLYFSKEMNLRSQTQLRMEGQLHRAVERGELFLEYQPVIDMSTGRISSFEALIRWRHPELGLVTPDNFIPMAENAGLIEAIGAWVLETACRQLNAWQASGHDHLSMAINLSPVQLRKAELADNIVGIVEQTGITPGSLSIEITESGLIQNLDTAVSIIERLSSVGIRVSLDDFGTGYSSLSYLKRFPIDIVKIDRSFLQDFPSHAHDTAIISAIIAMAHSLGLHVIAEGVETEEQLKVLQSLKCDEIQGYLFSKPISREQATALLSSPSNIRRKVWAAGSHEKLTNNSALSGVLNNAPSRKAANQLLQ